MVGNGGQRGRATILVAALVGASSLAPSMVTATDDSTQVLPDITVAALTTDLDGDGAREVIRLVQENNLDFAVDAWTHDGARWSRVGSAALPRAAGRPESFVAGGQAASLLLWQDGRRERVLALSAALAPGDQTGATCCLTISELRLSSAGGLDLALLQRVDTGAQLVWSADVDGRGSDELVLHHALYGATEDEQTATMQVLRWDGATFEPAFEQTDRQLLYGFVVADTDGVAGEDLLIGPGTDGRIRRLAWADGEMRMDQASIDAGEPPEGWIVGVADGAIVLSLGQEARVVRWPRGQPATTVGRLGTLGYPGVSVVGDGPDALVVVQNNLAFENGRSPVVGVHDLGLQPLGEVGISPGTEGFWRLVSGQTASWSGRRNIHPYSGPIHGGLQDGRPAYVSSGMLIQPGGPDGFEARPVASLIGVQPIGLVGPRDAWMALAGGYGGPPGIGYMNWGGVPPEWGTLTVVPLDRLFRTGAEADAVSFELLGAVEVARDADGATLVADGEGFQVAVTAPAGSAVVVVNGAQVHEREVRGEPLLVDVAPPRNRPDDENVDLEAMLLVVTPDGRGITEQWEGTFVREPPEISVSATTDALALSATISGRASPGSQVAADGAAIETDEAGRFSASISAPIWPSRVLVTARDPLGNEATELVEVVGVVDYRGLPWAAILIVATLLVGGVLYVRTPKRRADVSLPDDDGRLEELELDAVDGSEPGGR